MELITLCIIIITGLLFIHVIRQKTLIVDYMVLKNNSARDLNRIARQMIVEGGYAPEGGVTQDKDGVYRQVIVKHE